MSLNVLVVDDSMVMRSMVIKTLRLSGVGLNEIHQASNGQDALHLLDHERVDLALVDINMPVMSGLELLDRIREKPEISELPVIVISTESSPARIRTIEQHCSSFVHKPFTPEVLREAILKATRLAL